MKKTNGILNDPIGIIFLIRVFRGIVMIVFKILLFPIRVVIYRINPLNVYRVKIINHE